MKHAGEIMSDNREERRFLLDTDGISGRIGIATSVEPVNISMSGMCLATYKWLKIGNEYHLELKDAKRIISLPGIIKWSFLSACRPGSDKKPGEGFPQYTAGVQFMGFSKNDKEALAALIADHKKEELSPSEGGGDGGMGHHLYIRAQHGPVPSSFPDQSIVKIGERGMLVFSISSMKIGEEFALSYLSQGHMPLTVRGRVVSCEPVTHGASSLFAIGIDFTHVRHVDEKTVQAIARECRNQGTHMTFTSEPDEGHCETPVEPLAVELQGLTDSDVSECCPKSSQYFIGDFT